MCALCALCPGHIHSEVFEGIKVMLYEVCLASVIHIVNSQFLVMRLVLEHVVDNLE